MTLEELRQCRATGRRVSWRKYRMTGVVQRIAKDGSWADMTWGNGRAVWSKRQPLVRLDEWEAAT